MAPFIILTSIILSTLVRSNESSLKVDEHGILLMDYPLNDDATDDPDSMAIVDEANITAEERNEIFQSFVGRDVSRMSYTKVETSKINFWNECYDEDTFVSHDECVNQCINHTSNATLTNNSSLVLYKLLSISEYQVIENGSMSHVLKAEVFDLNDTSTNATILVCFPLSLTFDLCQKTFLNLDEVGLLPKDRKLWSFKLRRYFEIEDYYVDKKREKVVVCATEKETVYQNVGFFQWVGLLISIVTLFVSIIESFSSSSPLNDKAHVLIRCHILVLFIGFIALLLKLYLFQYTERLCVLFSMIQQYSFLSAFFWINAQAIELYVMKGEGYSRFENGKYPRRFTYYILFAVLVPAFVGIITYIAEFFQIPGMYPMFGKYCWFISDSYEILFFYHGWMGTSLIINIVLLVLTLKRFSPVASPTDAIMKFQKMMKMTMRLEIILVLFWIIKFISWLTGGSSCFVNGLETATYYQGLFVFLVCCCKLSINRCKRKELPSNIANKPNQGS